MKQKDKELLLKDLCARLSYGLILKTDNVFPQKLEGISFDKDTFVVWLSDGGFTLDCMDCKPYLFPLSSMTRQQKAELSMLVVGVEDIFKSFLIEVEFYHKHHIDYRGLIPMGLAIDATNLNIY